MANSQKNDAQLKSYQALLTGHIKDLDERISYYKQILAEDEIIEGVFIEALSESTDN